MGGDGRLIIFPSPLWGPGAILGRWKKGAGRLRVIRGWPGKGQQKTQVYLSGGVGGLFRDKAVLKMLSNLWLAPVWIILHIRDFIMEKHIPKLR